MKTPLITKRQAIIALSTIGMLTCSTGTLLEPSIIQSLCFSIGSALMALSAAIDRSLFFCLLSALAAVSGIIGMSEFSDISKILLPIGGATFCVWLLHWQHQLNSLWQLFGAFGLLLLALGYAVIHPAVYFVGGAVLCVFSAVEYSKGLAIALYWALLNVIFCITSGIALYQLYTV